MKKIIYSALFMLTTPAWAATEGNYLTLNLINTDAQLEDFNNEDFNPFGVESDNQVSFGIAYRYAINFEEYFIAPKVFFDYNNLSLTDASNNSWDIDYSFGAGVDLGYDIYTDIAVGITAGVGTYEYAIDLSSGSNSSSEGFSFAGGFLEYEFADNFVASIAYEFSKVELKDPNNNISEFEINVFRAGISYKF